MVEAEEVESLATFGQMDDAGLGRFGFEPEAGQQGSQPHQRGLRLSNNAWNRRFGSALAAR